MAECEVSPRRTVMVNIPGRHGAEVRLAVNHTVVKTLTPDGTD